MLIINILGLALIGLIIWWFWLYKPRETEALSEDITIRVENGIYEPSRIVVAAHRPTVLKFLRIDQSPCSEMLILPDCSISVSLPVNQTMSIELPALDEGRYPFHCQMQMYRGELIVRK